MTLRKLPIPFLLAGGGKSRRRKNSGFDFALKGRGFSRAIRAAKSMAAKPLRGGVPRNPTSSPAF